MKKRASLKYILAFLTVVFLLLALSSDYIASNSDNLNRTAQRLQLILQKKKQLLQHDMEEMQNRLTKKMSGRQRYNNFAAFEEDLYDDGFALFALNNDSLIYWSDKSVILPEKQELKDKNNTVFKFNNGWYYLQQQTYNNIHFIGLILIKKEYPYNNKFLQNKFTKAFNISANYQLTINANKGSPIYDENKKYICSIYGGDMAFATQQRGSNSGIYYGIALVLFLVLISKLLRGIRNRKKGLFALLLWGVLLLLLRYAMLKWNIPSGFSQLEIFSPILFASSFWLPSLGDFLLNVFFIYLFIATFSRYSSRFLLESTRSMFTKTAFFIAFNILYWILFLLFAKWLQNLVYDSGFSLQLFVFQNSGVYVLFGFLIVVLMIYTLGEVVFFIAREAQINWSFPKFLVVPFVVGALAVIASQAYKNYTIPFVLTPLLLLFLIMIFSNKRYLANKHSLHMLLMLLIAVVTTAQINYLSEKKEQQDHLVAAMNLATEYDPASENLLVDMQPKIDADTVLTKLCRTAYKNEEQIINHLQKRYFSGYWEQFNLQFTICNEHDNLTIKPDDKTQNCYQFFEEIIAKSGEIIPSTKFYSLNEFNGIISYLGILEFGDEAEKKIRIFIRLDLKVDYEGLGYPDLLLEGKISLRNKKQNYSYAKYRNGNLIASSGKFNYYPNIDFFVRKAAGKTIVTLDDYNHTLYQFKNNMVVVSSPSHSWYSQLITIPYIFVLLYLLGFVILILRKYPWNFNFKISFKYRIQYAIVGLLMLFFMILMSGTVYYNVKQSNDDNNRILQEKLSLIKQEIGGINLHRVKIVTNYLRRLSSLIYADINIYNTKGELITSSRMEIFDKKLQSRKMNFVAYSQLSERQKTSFIHLEKIGKLSYLSAYELILNENNEVIGYVNLPYFLKSEALQHKMFNLILASVNLHLLIILLAIILSVFLSNKLTRPLRTIQNRLKATRIGTYGEKIDYVNDDEIGELVSAYNEMQAELEKSAEKLALSERESAWREMARQIAHEIKNPLTPMKLSIQFLQRRFAEHSSDREEQFGKISNTLIEQINALSAIATAFSNFAKMPPANNQKQNLIAILQHVVALFQSENTTISLHTEAIENATVFIDKERFIRVFVNLINNAIQAIPESTKGIITMNLHSKKESYVVQVTDNGTGITEAVKEKLFYPNFTTKSSGMGLGLAITKKIVENANGKIWVESEVGKGASFFVELPKE